MNASVELNLKTSLLPYKFTNINERRKPFNGPIYMCLKVKGQSVPMDQLC
jgi:hypothetical protein